MVSFTCFFALSVLCTPMTQIRPQIQAAEGIKKIVLRLQILEAAAGQVIAQMTRERAQLLENLPKMEDWRTHAAPRGSQALASDPPPVTSAPSLLSGIVDSGMAQVGDRVNDRVMIVFMIVS